jgi:hypothetical protein
MTDSGPVADGTNSPDDPLEQSRQALSQGDVGRAGVLARSVAGDPTQPAPRRDEARHIAEGIGIDPVTIAAAALAIVVLLYVASQSLGH